MRDGNTYNLYTRKLVYYQHTFTVQQGITMGRKDFFLILTVDHLVARNVFFAVVTSLSPSRHVAGQPLTNAVRICGAEIK